MKLIPLTGGLSTMVDDADYEFLNQWKWWTLGKRHKYVCRWSGGGHKTRRRIFMHKLLLGCGSEFKGDHIDLNTLNNQRSNLRVATNAQNLANRGPTRYNTSGFKGVTWCKPNKKWVAYIGGDARTKYLGSFDNKEDAARAYDLAAINRYGEFAWTNQKLRSFT